MSKPVLNPYKNLTPFKLACITNFPFIEADFDAITNYELLSLVVKYLNEVIENENTVTTNVQLLAEAFNNLYDSVTEDIANMQEDMTEKFAEQDALIQQYFSDINIQTFVDNKINEMITNGDFEELINNAISEINPSALDDTKKVNVIDLGITLVNDIDKYAVNSNFTLDDNVKAKILAILNDMKTKNANIYYFKNAHEDYLDNTYKIDAHFSDSPAHFILWVDYDVASDQNLSYNDSYIRQQNYNITIVDDVITDYSIDYSNYRTIECDFIKANNTASFTPTGPYNVATKKYVDDNAGGGGSVDNFYNYVYTDSNTSISAFNFYISDATDMKNLCDIITEAVTKGEKNILIAISNTLNQMQLFKFQINNVSLTTNGTLMYRVFVDQQNFKTLYAYSGDSTYYSSMQLNYTVSNGEVVSLTQGFISTTNNGRYLPIGNTASWNPSNDYDPATKRYVDYESKSNESNFLSLIDTTNTQSYSGDPLCAFKQGEVVNIRGTIEVLSTISVSMAGVTINDQVITPNEMGNSNWTECYTTAFLYRGSTSTYYPLACYIIFVATDNFATIRFYPFDSSVTQYLQGDAIRFSLSFIKKG